VKVPPATPDPESVPAMWLKIASRDIGTKPWKLDGEAKTHIPTMTLTPAA